MMPQTITNLTTPVQQSTCADCFFFKDYQDRGRGECLVFDKVVRQRHLITSDCVQQINRKTKQGEGSLGLA